MSMVRQGAAASIPSSQIREALCFLGTILLILVPTFACLAGVEAIAWRVGETWSPAAIARWQSLAPGRMWRDLDGRSYLTYKVARIKLLRPQVIMLGQSRANLVNAGMMKPYTFYNSGQTAWTFDQYRRYLALITKDGYAPKALFFNLDYWMFVDGYDKNWNNAFSESAPTHLEDLKAIIDELATEPRVLLARLSVADNLKGLFAVRNGDGFKADGSMVALPVPSGPHHVDNDGIHVGNLPAVFGDHFDTDDVISFERFTAFARSMNIALIGIQFPFYAKVLNGLNGRAGAAEWRDFRSDARRRYFASNGVLFFDFADMPEYRNVPGDFYDSVHPALNVVQDVMRRVLSDDRVRAILPDLQPNM